MAKRRYEMGGDRDQTQRNIEMYVLGLVMVSVLNYGKLISFGALLKDICFYINFYHCIVVFFELCIDDNQILIFLPPGSLDAIPFREIYIQIGMAYS